MVFVLVGLDGFRETWVSHIVVRISARLFRHAPRVPFSLSSAYNWIYQVKVETDECHAFVLQRRWHVPLGRRLIPAKRECQTSAASDSFAVEIPRDTWPRLKVQPKSVPNRFSMDRKLLNYRLNFYSLQFIIPLAQNPFVNVNPVRN